MLNKRDVCGWNVELFLGFCLSFAILYQFGILVFVSSQSNKEIDYGTASMITFWLQEIYHDFEMKPDFNNTAIFEEAFEILFKTLHDKMSKHWTLILNYISSNSFMVKFMRKTLRNIWARSDLKKPHSYPLFNLLMIRRIEQSVKFWQDSDFERQFHANRLSKTGH